MRDFKSHVRHDSEGWLRDLLLLAVCLAVPFFQYLGLPLLDPDEGRYAEIPREMLERGDLITPTLNYVKYFEKPPLLYWLNAASFKVFGLNEFAARFPSALCGLLTVLATYIVCRSLYGRRAALLSALVLGTSTGFVLQSRIILTDMLLTFCLTAALGAFIVAAGREGRRSRPLPWYLFYFFCACAVLAKGLVGMVFPAGIIFLYLLVSRRWRLLGEMRLVGGLLLFLAVAAPWFVAVSLRNPEFARFFFIHEHFERFTSTVHGRYKPFWFFLPVLAVTMLPWSFFVPVSLVRTWRDRYHEEGRAGIYLLIWAVLIFLFFSKSNSKLIPYILPVFPPLAILVGRCLDEVAGGRGREFKGAGILLGAGYLVLAAASAGAARLPQLIPLLKGHLPRAAELLAQSAGSLPPVPAAAWFVLSGLFLVLAIGTLRTAGRSTLGMVTLLCAGSFLLELLIPRLLVGDILRAESPRLLAQKAVSLAGPETRLVTVGPMQAVSWYTGRRVMVTGDWDELTFGSRQGDHGAWFLDPKAFISLWSGDHHVLLFLQKKEFDYLKTILKPVPVIKAESGQRMLVSNR